MWKTRTKKKTPETKILQAHCEQYVDRFFGTGLTGSCTGTGFGTEPEPGIPVPDFYPPDPKRTEPDWNRIRFFGYGRFMCYILTDQIFIITMADKNKSVALKRFCSSGITCRVNNSLTKWLKVLVRLKTCEID